MIDEFASLPFARAYIDIVRAGISSLGSQELLDAVQRLRRAYHEFPELELDRPRRELSEGLRSAVEKMLDRASIPLLIHIVAFDPVCSSSMTWLFERIPRMDNRQFRKRSKPHVIIEIISKTLAHLNFSGEEAAANLGDILAHLLSDEHPVGKDSGALAKAAQSARRRLGQPALDGNKLGSRDVLLAMAQRLRAAPSPRLSNQPLRLDWPSGRLSFDEFLLQWPCAIELPVDLNDAAFIGAAYQAILLRGPGVAEMDQYRRLLKSGVVSEPWIIEDLLASEEFRSFERRVRVIWGGHVITEPERPEAENMPAVTWPWQLAT